MIEDVTSFAERAQRHSFDAQFLLDFVEFAGLLEATQTGDDRIEEGKKQQSQILVTIQFSIAGRIASGADVMKPLQKGLEVIEILVTANVFLLDTLFGARSAIRGRHVPTPL